MRRIYLFILPVLLANICAAQIKFTCGGGLGSYAMGDMKSIQNNFASQFPVTPKITDAFPSYYMFEGGVLGNVGSQLWCGVTLSTFSTGGRVSYKDYSGALRIDQLASAVSIGIPFQYQLSDDDAKNQFFLELAPHITMGKLKIKSFSQLGNSSNEQIQSFSELGLGVQPSLVFEKKINRIIGIYLKAGYFVQVYNDKLYLDKNHDYYLLNPDNKNAQLDWTGLRLSGGLAFKIVTFK